MMLFVSILDNFLEDGDSLRLQCTVANQLSTIFQVSVGVHILLIAFGSSARPGVCETCLCLSHTRLQGVCAFLTAPLVSGPCHYP